MVAKRRGGKRGGGSRKPGNQWSEADMQNEKMNAYYKAQAILPEDEFEQHLEAFRKPLPTTFRITGTRESAGRMRDYMQRTFIPYLSGKMFEGKPLAPPEAIDWYPDQLAYQLDIPKQAIRRNPDFQAFQKFLVMESDSGNVVRQEVVSMIPPLLMNIKPDSTCLDLCAAPGSKTSQMVEYLHEGVKLPTGFVMANDSDFKRAHMLVHQVKRLNSPNFIVTNHDATFISNFHTDDNRTVQKFDRILADVPCSGDGTLRKNFDVWKNWNVSSGLSLHPTQVNCLRRGLQMLAVGGRLVYSTCSLNPIENEAVLNAVLSQVDGAAHLVDVSDQLPTLKRRPGLHTWKAVDKLGNFIQSMDDVKGDKNRFPTSIFPPSAEQAQALHLERALRVYPHLSNTGGFFVAVIDKVKEISADFESVRNKSAKRNRSERLDGDSKRLKQDVEEIKTEEAADPGSLEGIESIEPSEDPAPQTTEVAVETNSNSNFKKSLNDEYFKFLAPDHPEVQEIARFYGLPEDFDLSCFLSRNISGDPVRSLYYTSPLVKKILEKNESRIKFVHAGVKIFHKQNVENLQDGTPECEDMCKWRVAQDGVDIIKDFVGTDKIIDCNFEELTIFMQHEFPRATLFPAREGSVADQLKGKKYGCYLLRCDLSKEPTSRIPETIVVPLWKSKVTIQMMIARQDKVAIYTRVTGKELPPAIRVDAEVARQLKQAKEDTDETTAGNTREDECEAIDMTIADAAAVEEEGAAANVL
ncbi:Putative tRNA [Taphrina deformans PYCC 5710]|uniref:tRNA n=1 Tax=Taphrina deformans (strain PYCC 5710 / ATCC 11124 / CBS 356.35 / IMI 108563 / JCM 9778 / NBRC 8474) TaxID=1097556 RepID=R4XJK1_TAPDE|nr:Putative tRNA [Taphrina deformans PYCC 5710]|eukprot:CCG83525.1 Putative tRNA [Taphrina deformans PYCC 5710]